MNHKPVDKVVELIIEGFEIEETCHMDLKITIEQKPNHLLMTKTHVSKATIGEGRVKLGNAHRFKFSEQLTITIKVYRISGNCPLAENDIFEFKGIIGGTGTKRRISFTKFKKK